MALAASQIPTIEEIRAEKARRSLSCFIRHFWRYIDPSEYIPGWHIDAICEHLQAVSDGSIRRLIINIPPRHMKSIATAVAWPAWDWVDTPERRFLFASYAQFLSVRDSAKCRRLIQSPLYQQSYGNRFELSGDQNTKIRFENGKNGYRIATSVGGVLTGEGGDIVVVDDAHNVGEVESDTMRQTVLDWWDEAMSTRLNNPKTGAFVIIMQRVHHNDLVGHILAKNQDWDHLCLPAEHETSHPTPSKTRLNFKDPRKKRGQLLCPERFGREHIDELKTTLGTYAAAGQLQQRPSPEEGGILKRRHWRIWPKQNGIPVCEWVMQSYDTAYSEKDMERNSYSARTTWGIFRHPKRGHNCALLLDVWRDHCDYPKLRKKAQKDYARAPHFDRAVDEVLIEKKASGQSLIQDLRGAGIPIRTYQPDRDKVARAYSIQALFEAELIYYLEGDTDASIVIDECSQFPTGVSDDLVDTCTQAWIRLRTMGLLVHPKNPRDMFDETEADIDEGDKSQRSRGVYG